jgi:hypothetical protein
VGFEGLVGLFEQTQTAMQTQAARSVDIALVVRNWLFGWYIVEFEKAGASRRDLYGKTLMPKLAKRFEEAQAEWEAIHEDSSAVKDEGGATNGHE